MKTASNPIEAQRAVETLRAEVRELREVVSELETRLAQIEEIEDSDPWNVWPYCWFISGWNHVRTRFHLWQGKLAERELERYNAASQNAARDEVRVLRLM